MRCRLAAAIVLLLLYVPAARLAAEQAAVAVPRLTNRLAETIDPVIHAVWSRFDADAAMADVRFAAPLWRLAGNADYDAVIDRVRTRLLSSAFPESAVHVESYALDTPAWDHTAATLALVRGASPD